MTALPPQEVPTSRTLLATVKRHASSVLLLGTALLSACSGPSTGPGSTGTSSQPDDALAAKYPYLPGVDYSWTDTQTLPSASRPWVGPTIRAQGGPTDTYLSDMTWTSATNGYGPVELNRSNGESKGGDGGTLTVAGVAYAKGLGLHASSDVLYSLGGNCSTFAAQVGVDDEVGNNGSVVFQLWNGAVGSGTKLYDSGKLTGADTARAVSVSLTGVNALHLVVTDAGDNNYYDHADWADAKVTCTATAPSGDKFVSDLNPTASTNGWGPFEKDKSNGEQAAGDGSPLSIRGVLYQKGLGVHANSSLTYALGGTCSTFSASVGVDDEVQGKGSVTFAVYGDGDMLYNSGPVTGSDGAKSVSANISGLGNLRLEVSGGASLDYDHADWGNAKLTCSTVTPKITAVGVTPGTASMTPGSTQQFTASIEGQGAYDPGVTWSSSNIGVVTVSSTGLATAQAVGSATITATSTFDTTKSGSSAVTVGASSTLPASGVQINFQPSGSSVPAGFIADTGAAYSAARGYGWVTEATAGTASAAPLDLSINTRDRATGNYTPQLNTMLHMQYNATGTGNGTPGAWEYALPSGTYTVTVAVGDAANNFDSSHAINIEGKVAISAFVPTDSRHFSTATLRVPVTDGKLTIDAKNGTNTKIDYVVIAPGSRPSVRVTSPQDAEAMINPNSPVTADVNVVSSAIDLGSLTSAAVNLTEHVSGTQVSAQLNTSGGGDVVVLQPAAALKPNTVYDFKVTAALKDTSGLSFLPTTRSFVTGSATTSGNGVAFEQVAQAGVPNDKSYTAVEIGPDNKLYAATLMGEILRFNILADGTLGTYQTITSVVSANGGPRTIIGMKFDPASTADNLIMWISNNYFWDGSSDAPDWSGKISRLSGPNLAVVQDYVVDLPRSIRDHQTNSIAFKPGEPNVLYITQGSDTAMGAPDDAWGNRPEHLLNAAVLRLDLSKLGSLPLSVKTEEGGLYNPYASGAPLTIFASGVRNAYDLVWHTNGQLYTPTNGSAAGGNTPGTPANLSASTACQNRRDGPYTAPTVPALTSVSVQNDYLFRVVQGGYYGHPNPTRCEWVMNGGNPTAGADAAEVIDYPVGTQPDRNYRGYAYDFGLHASPNGVIEEYTLSGNSALKNKLMVVRYSAGKDIIILTPGGASNDIISSQSGVTGLTNFNPSPLDLTEDHSNGNLYVAQLDETTGGGTITLVRPK